MKAICRTLLVAAAALLVVTGCATSSGSWTQAPTGRQVHVAPNGTPQGDGTAARPLDLVTALGAKSPAQPGDAIVLAGGTYEGAIKGTARVPFEFEVSGAPGRPVLVMPTPGASVHLNGTVTLRSSHARYFDLDIGDLQWDPTRRQHQAETALNVLAGEETKVINCNIFGGAMGTGLWSPAKNLELYGCLVHDFGYLEESGGRGHGHACYTQNETGVKTIKHNIAYRGCGWNLHIYTQAGQIIGFDVIENIMYLAGAAKPGQTMDNYLVAGYPPADRIRLLGNVGYQPSRILGYRPNARLSNYRAVTNGVGEVRDNYLMGANYGLSAGTWKHLEVTGNTIWAGTWFVEISSSPTGSAIPPQAQPPALAGYRVERNTYVANGVEKCFIYGRNENPKPEDQLTFAEWQRLGLDAKSSLVPGKDGRPVGNRVFVFPNAYRQGRAQVAIANWDGLSEVAVDLGKVLRAGQGFVAYNCLDIRTTLAAAKPVLTGTWQGKPVAFPMRKDPMSPDFDAFLVLPR